MKTTHEAPLVTLAIENDVRRKVAMALLEEMHLRYSLTNLSVSIADKEILARSSVIVLDTNDDAASLVHIVHEIYKLFPRQAIMQGTIPILGILSATQYQRNPRFQYWLINGSAAVLEILTFDHPGFLIALRKWIRVLTDAESSAK